LQRDNHTREVLDAGTYLTDSNPTRQRAKLAEIFEVAYESRPQEARLIAAALVAASTHTPEEKAVRGALAEIDPELVKMTDGYARALAHSDATYDDVIDAALALEEALRLIGPPSGGDGEGKEDGPKDAADRKRAERRRKREGAEAEAAAREAMENAADKEGTHRAGDEDTPTARYVVERMKPHAGGDNDDRFEDWPTRYDPFSDALEVEIGVRSVVKKALRYCYSSPTTFGTMRVEECELTVAAPRPTRHHARKRHATDRAGEIGAIHRLRMDGKILRRLKRNPAKKRTGTLLVDMSGSMSLSERQVREILDVAPYAVIATYSGAGTNGILRIIARNGRTVAAIPHGWGGNIVDGPALEWLAEHPEPRIWLSDGFVTGRHDHVSEERLREAHSLCVENRIVRVSRPAVLFDTLDDLARRKGIDQRLQL
jgi:hypothetical protein